MYNLADQVSLSLIWNNNYPASVIHLLKRGTPRFYTRDFEHIEQEPPKR